MNGRSVAGGRGECIGLIAYIVGSMAPGVLIDCDSCFGALYIAINNPKHSVDSSIYSN